MKKKLIMIGICAIILLIVFAKNIFIRMNLDKKDNQTDKEMILREGEMITAQESLRLLGYLGIDEDELKQVVNTNNYLEFEECRSLIKIVSTDLEVESDAITKNLSYNIQEEMANKAVLTEEFLNLYEGILAALPTESAPVLEKTMFILGSPNNTATTSKSEEVMVTDQGNYTYEDSTSYDRFYTDGILNLENEKLQTTDEQQADEKQQADDEQQANEEEQATKKQQPNTVDDLSEKLVTSEDNLFHLEEYTDCKVSAIVCGTKLVYVKDVLAEDTILHNVWITTGSQGTISTFLYDIARDFDTKYNLSQEIVGKIGDLVIRDRKIVKISIKPDIIGGKVLVANQEYIEIEGYGKLQLDDNYKIYKIYDELSMEVTNSILVGYKATDFVVADGKVVAALIKETIKAENIRVLIKTNQFESNFHQKVQLTADREFTVTIGDKKTTYKKGEELTFSSNDDSLAQGRVHIETKSENGKIKILSLNRADGSPSYRGSIEIASTENGLLIINELSIEEYLYAVLPSEMPSSYGLEALKVQAICARSYAYNQLFANGYNEYGAHVDDSSSYQVYNNIAENENTILAVKDTYGKVIKYDGSVITAFYFSTSCGHTASLEEVWGNYDKADYLLGKIQTTYEMVDGEAIYTSTQLKDKGEPDFSSEEVFRKFIQEPTETTYDSEFAWYRWNVTVSLDDLKQSIDKNLAQRYNANPALIQTLVNKDASDEEQYQSVPVSTIGTVKDVLIGKREKSGILSEIILVGSECTIKISTEYNIRTLLAPINDEVVRQDDSVTANLSMLPSAFFIIDKDEKNIIFQGGGYGHGVGMSQNGAKAMTDSGKGYEEVIKHYYTGVELGYIY